MESIGLDILYHNIIPLLGSSDDLLRLKLTSKFFNDKIITHSFNLECYKCKRKRFRISSNRNDCYIKNCYANDIAHPVIKYWYNNKPFCSFTCSTSYYLSKSNKYFLNDLKNY